MTLMTLFCLHFHAEADVTTYGYKQNLQTRIQSESTTKSAMKYRETRHTHTGTLM